LENFLIKTLCLNSEFLVLIGNVTLAEPVVDYSSFPAKYMGNCEIVALGTSDFIFE